MFYEVKKDKIVQIYNVTYNKERLKDILDELEKYSYISVGIGKMGGNVTRWPVTKKNIQKRVSSIFYSREWYSDYNKRVVFRL